MISGYTSDPGRVVINFDEMKKSLQETQVPIGSFGAFALGLAGKFKTIDKIF